MKQKLESVIVLLAIGILSIALSGCKSGYPYLTTDGMSPAPWENNHDEVMGGSVYRSATNEVPAVIK